MVEVVARAAQELADRSTVPFVPEVATLLLVMLSFASERRDCVAEATSTANWCSGILHILDDADRVLREVGPSLMSVAHEGYQYFAGESRVQHRIRDSSARRRFAFVVVVHAS